MNTLQIDISDVYIMWRSASDSLETVATCREACCRDDITIFIDGIHGILMSYIASLLYESYFK